MLSIRSFVAASLGAFLSLAAVNSASALTISHAGVSADLGGVTAQSPWRNSSVAKLDIDGNNVLGSDGYYVVGNNARTLVPRYLTNFNDAGISTFGGIGGYAQINDPNTTPGASPTNIQSGTKNPFPGTGNETKVFSFDVQAGAPSTFRVGVMMDNLDIAAYNPSALRLVQTVGGAAISPTVATSAAGFNNRTPDWVFFDVTGAVAGDRIEVRAFGGPNGCACSGAFSFDNIGGPLQLWNVDVQGATATQFSGAPTNMSGNDPRSPFGAGGGQWNLFNVITYNNGVSVNPSQALSDSNGVATPVTFSITGGVQGFNNAGNALTADYLFINAGSASPNVGFQLSGLIPGATYDFWAIAGDIANRDFNILIDSNGNLLLGDETSQNVTSAGRLFANLIASADGRIVGQMNNDGAEGNLAGFQLRLVSAATGALPEPATMSLLAAGVAGLALRRRRIA